MEEPKDATELCLGVVSICRYKLSPCSAAARLVAVQVFFAATGVSDGDLVRGVRFVSGGATTNSVVMRGKSQTGADAGVQGLALVPLNELLLCLCIIF